MKNSTAVAASLMAFLICTTLIAYTEGAGSPENPGDTKLRPPPNYICGGLFGSPNACELCCPDEMPIVVSSSP
ncbi:hypothetical protein QQ045_016204 [Rhodiola kirilowii]